MSTSGGFNLQAAVGCMGDLKFARSLEGSSRVQEKIAQSPPIDTAPRCVTSYTSFAFDVDVRGVGLNLDILLARHPVVTHED